MKVKSGSNRLRFLILIFALTIFSATTTLAKGGGTYSVSRWEETIIISVDSSIEITEKVTFKFTSGDFGYAYRTILHQGFDQLVDVSVAYANGLPLAHNVRGGLFGAYLIEWEWERITVGSTPVEKTFILKYKPTEVMNYKNSESQRDRLYLNIVTDYEVPISNMTIDVYLPSTYSTEAISAKAYYSAPVPRSEITKSGALIRYDQALVGARQDYTIDIYFPATVIRPSPKMTNILAQVYTALIIPGTIAYLILWYRRRKDPDIPPQIGDAPPTRPKELKSPEAGVLIRGRRQIEHLLSELFDLAERGYVRILATSKKGPVVGIEGVDFALSDLGSAATDSSKPEDLKPYERSILDKLSTINQNIQHSQIDYLKPIETSLVERGMFKPSHTDKKIFLSSILFATITPLLITLGFMARNIWFIIMGLTNVFPAIALAVIGFIGRLKLGGRTMKGVMLKRKVESYLKALKNSVEENIDGDPYLATENIIKNTPWLLLDFDWLAKTSNRINFLLRRSLRELKERPIRVGQLELPPYIYLESLNPFLAFVPFLIFPEIFGFFYWMVWRRSGRGIGWFGGGFGGGAGGGAAGGGGGAR